MERLTYKNYIEEEYISTLIEAIHFAIKERNTMFSKYIKETIKTEELETELAELKQKAIVLEKAFELACDPRDDWGGEKYSGTEFNNYHDYFIAEAQKELAEIGGKDE